MGVGLLHPDRSRGDMMTAVAGASHLIVKSIRAGSPYSGAFGQGLMGISLDSLIPPPLKIVKS
jgi:hypothetical protein